MYWLRSERQFVEIFTQLPRWRDGRWRAPRVHVFEPLYVKALDLAPYLNPGQPRESVLSEIDRGQPLRCVRIAPDDLVVFNRFQPVIAFCDLGARFGGMADVPLGEPRWAIFR